MPRGPHARLDRAGQAAHRGEHHLRLPRPKREAGEPCEDASKLCTQAPDRSWTGSALWRAWSATLLCPAKDAHQLLLKPIWTGIVQ